MPDGVHKMNRALRGAVEPLTCLRVIGPPQTGGPNCGQIRRISVGTSCGLYSRQSFAEQPQAARSLWLWRARCTSSLLELAAADSRDTSVCVGNIVI